MTLQEAIQARHSVRKYVSKEIPADVIAALQEKIEEINKAADLHVQLVTDEPKAFAGPMAYGKFSGVTSYLVMAGKKSPDLDFRVGYYGEQLVLLAQQLGLNSCWAGVSYTKVKGTYKLAPDEKIACYIALGYGQTQGVAHKSKPLEELSNLDANSPEWFRKGVEAASLAPTAINQQKFSIEYHGSNGSSLPEVSIRKGFSMVGYTQMDMGIAKLHFEIGAGVQVSWNTKTE
ncbi:MAG: nitroreductase family protein [Candidatus Cryptobacteroides sp.]